jgi:hypothetical protein
VDPGDFPAKWGALKVLTCLEGMSSFAKAIFLEKADSITISRAAFASFFIPNGLPKLVVFDAGSKFAGAMTKMCTNLGIPFHTVAKENHKAILNERFHGYLNKVEKIHQADCESLDQWTMGVFFALYGWNASPVDGTNITRSLAAKGREFHFPIDVAETPPKGFEGTNTAEWLLQHIECVFPLWDKQKRLLRILNDDRKQYHQDLKNKNRNMKEFHPGNLVIIRKQVKTTIAAGISAKLMMRTRGPYRVIERLGDGTSYQVKRIPFTKGKGILGRLLKEATARMELLPSRLIISKKADGIDTQLAQLDQPMVTNPLEKFLGAYQFGTYCWTNMRTRTKRTRGTENPDAFIRLNMRIVRVAHFSFITQVERQLCIVNQGYTIVTKQQ